ncbi:hypothetical protein GCM10007874_52150 [Labrys miyagiensis]|uniref:Uncharacterized protein n=1 Tax=Labrys miyagiensis TaxID=346912 RepID=A0ABQ6CPB8_9HYPH|nr:hypothetical protein [Labrys miyagiensis]GLS22198.1 hypothetical protein GCM10007874_52150 [Labrys miyagiensis]
MTEFRTISLAFAGLLISTAAWAVDRPSPSDLPDLTKIRAEQGTQTFNNKALDSDPNDKDTVEYQGEFYTESGDIPKAHQNLARLKTLCPNGCEKREDLERALSKVAKSR